MGEGTVFGKPASTKVFLITRKIQGIFRISDRILSITVTKAVDDSTLLIEFPNQRNRKFVAMNRQC